MFRLEDVARLAFSVLFIFFLIYLLAAEQFTNLLWIVLLYLFFNLLITLFFRRRQRKNLEEAVRRYIAEPSPENEEAVLQEAGIAYPALKELSMKLMNEQAKLQALKQQRVEDSILIERWVHEVKTPLALFLLLLENAKDELDPELYGELHRLREEIEHQLGQMLYYSKLDAKHPDLRFETTDLNQLLMEAIESYQYEANLRKINFDLQPMDLKIWTDPRILQLILSQILSNALKYSEEGKSIHIYLDDHRLSIRDEGPGCKKEELPFLFDRAFSGYHPKRGESTGLGLYLVKVYSEKIGVDVTIDPSSCEGHGFLIHLDFPQNKEATLE